MRLPYRFVAPVLQHIQLPLDHRLHGDNANTSFDNAAAQIVAVATHGLERLQIQLFVFALFKKSSQPKPTSRMLGMRSLSQSLRKESLSKEGSTFRISVRTSDISVLEKSPPKDQRTQPQEDQGSSTKRSLNWTRGAKLKQSSAAAVLLNYCVHFNADSTVQIRPLAYRDNITLLLLWSLSRLSPMRSVILSVTARDALIRVLSLSSYFIFISKNPAKQKRGRSLAAASDPHLSDLCGFRSIYSEMTRVTFVS